MTYVLAFLKALAALPAIGSYAMKLYEAITSWLEQQRRERESKDFEKKLDEIKAKPGPEKDTCELEKKFNPDKQCGPRP